MVFRGNIAVFDAKNEGDVGPIIALNRLKIKSAAEVLKRLTEKGLVERVERGQYRLSDPLFAEYVKRRSFRLGSGHAN